jgi:hypothetical protein
MKLITASADNVIHRQKDTPATCTGALNTVLQQPLRQLFFKSASWPLILEVLTKEGVRIMMQNCTDLILGGKTKIRINRIHTSVLTVHATIAAHQLQIGDYRGKINSLKKLSNCGQRILVVVVVIVSFVVILVVIDSFVVFLVVVVLVVVFVILVIVVVVVVIVVAVVVVVVIVVDFKYVKSVAATKWILTTT